MSDTDSEDGGHYPVTVAARVSQETSDNLDRYIEQESDPREAMGRSVAARHLIRDGLDRELDDTDTDGDTDTDPANLVLLLGFLLTGGVALGYSSGGNPDTTLIALAGALIGTGAYMKWR